MNKSLFFVWLSLFTVSSLSCESFIVQKTKKQKKMSASSIKEETGQTYAKIQKEISKLLADYSNVLRVVHDDLKDLLEGDKQSFFAKAKTQETKNYLDYLSNFKDTVKSHRKFLDSQTCVLKNKNQSSEKQELRNSNNKQL